MVALTAAEQPEEVLGHAGQVVGRRSPQRVAGRALGPQTEGGHPIDMGGDAVVTDDHVEAVAGLVLAERHPSRVEQAAEARVAVEAATGLQVSEEGDGLADRRAGAEALGIVDTTVAGVLEAGLQGLRLDAGRDVDGRSGHSW